MSAKVHVPYGLAIIILSIIAGTWYQKSIDAREKLKAATDSAAAAERVLDAKAAALLARLHADSAEQAKTDSGLHAKDAQIRAIGVAVATATTLLAAQLTARQQTLLDSVFQLDSTRLAVVASQRDAAIALFHRAAADRDSLTLLVVGYQRQLTFAVANLRHATRTPFLDSRPVRLAQTALAIKGAIDLLQGR